VVLPAHSQLSGPKQQLEPLKYRRTAVPEGCSSATGLRRVGCSSSLLQLRLRQAFTAQGRSARPAGVPGVPGRPRDECGCGQRVEAAAIRMRALVAALAKNSSPEGKGNKDVQEIHASPEKRVQVRLPHLRLENEGPGGCPAWLLRSVP
jgi:hypothetical protein